MKQDDWSIMFGCSQMPERTAQTREEAEDYVRPWMELLRGHGITAEFLVERDVMYDCYRYTLKWSEAWPT